MATDGGRVGIGTTSPGAKLDVQGQVIGGFGAQTTSGTLNWNDTSNARSGSGYALLFGSHANGPGPSYYYHPFSFEYSSKNGAGNMTQFAIPYYLYDGLEGNSIFFRRRYSGAWSGWAQIITTNVGKTQTLLPGNVGIGTTGPGAKLDVRNGHLYVGDESFSNPGSWDETINLDSNVHARILIEERNTGTKTTLWAHTGGNAKVGTISNHHFGIITNGGEKITILTNGNVGIGWSPSYKLDVNGTIRCYGWVICSSKDCKKEIRAFSPSDYKDALNTAKNLNLYHFRYKDKDKDTLSHIGLLSEDAPQELLSSSGKEIDIPDTVGFLLAIAKAQQQETETLREKNYRLEQRIKRLEKEVVGALE